MDLIRFGLVIRALRRRRGWRQLDLAAAAGVSQGTVSMIERGHSERLANSTLTRVAAALGARLGLDLRWRGGELDRLLDHDHAELVGALARLLEAAGWDIRVEVSYAVYGENGSIDVLAWHAETRSLLVIEVKTEVTSGEATLRKLDEKVRHARSIALARFAWNAVTVSRLLVVEDSSTARDRVEAGMALFTAAFPTRTVAVRSWLRTPMGALSGLLFFRNTNRERGTSRPGGRHRVRQGLGRGDLGRSSVTKRPADARAGMPSVTILTNRTEDYPGS